MNQSTSKYLNTLAFRCLICLALFRAEPIFAQSQNLSDDYILKHWTVEDGLPVNEIVSMAQTQDGYIWLATFDGLVRFDGDQFTVFNSGNISAFPTNRFIELKVDRHNNLWILTEKVQNNEVLIAYHSGQFTVFGPDEGVEGDVNLQLDPEGNLLVGSNNGAFYYDGEILQSFGDELKGKFIRKVTRNSVGDSWFATDEGVFRLNDGNWTQLTEQDGLNSKNVYAVYIGQTGKVWVATDRGINALENGNITSQAITWPRPVDTFMSIYENPKNPNQVFINNERQYLYSFKQGQFSPYPNEADQGLFNIEITIDQSETIWSQMRNKLFRDSQLVYVADAPINHIFRDKIGNIWVAQEDGLIQLKPRLIKTYNKNISLVYPITEDQDGVVWATQNTSDLFQLQGDTFQEVIDKAGIPNRLIYSIYASTDGQIWIGVVNGVYLWDKKSSAQPLKIPLGSADIPEMIDIKAIQEDAIGNMWFGGTNGIHRLDINGNWSHFGKIGNDNIVGVRLIYITQDSTLWFGTNGNGLLYLKDGKLNQLDTDQGLSGNIIRSMHEDKEGIFWIGTEGWGLNRIEHTHSSNMEGAKITIYKKQHGLFDNVIHQILDDDLGRFWMNSNRGLFWVDKSELTAFANGEISSVYSFFYSEQDGLPGREGNGGIQPAGFKSQTGELWFPMLGGIARIDPKLVQTPSLDIFIEQISIADSSWHVSDHQEEVLPIGQRGLQIKYAALDFSTSPGNIRYRYKLVGVDETWVEAGNKKEAVYNRLPPGTFTFRVMANNGGGWMENEATLQLTFPYFFYETYWFYAIIILLITLVIYRGMNWRIRILKRQGKVLEDEVALRTYDLIREKEETERQREIATEALQTIEKQAAVLKELDQAKSRFFTNISHEFRTPLTLIIGPLEQQIEKLRAGMAGDEEDMELALRNSKRLLRLVNQILEVAKLESGHTQLQVQLIDLRTVIEPIVDAFRSLAERNGTHFHSELPAAPVMVYIDMDLMEKAIINLFSNAFKFTPKDGRIEVRVTEEVESVSISVKDNGPGISKEEQEHIFKRFYQVNESINSIQAGTGIGLSLVHELIALHNGTIELISEPGMGSEFLIKLQSGKIPLEHVDLPDEKVITDQSSTRFISNLTETDPEQNPQRIQKVNDIDQPTLLIVEDNADIRAYVKKHLSGEYNIIEAENGLEGFQMTEEALPDLVISDVMMPVSDGYELCRKIKQHPDLDFIPVILLTAKAEKSMKIEGLELGADDYVIKPFEIDELKARVRNLIHSRQKLKERLVNLDLVSENPDLMGWVDTPFANNVRGIIEQHLGNEDFSVVQLAEEVKIGRTTLYSRIVELTGKTPSEMIRLTRLHQASRLLKEEAGNISEIAYATGFKSISHFSKTFKAEFGMTPTQYTRPQVERSKP